MSDSSAAGIKLLEGLQSEAYLNHEDWRYQLDVERDARERQLTAWRMSEQAALDLAMHHPAGTNVRADVKRILDSANEPPPAVSLPTQFQNPNDYRILDGLRTRIDQTADRTKVSVPPGVTLGTLPMGDVEARTWLVAGTDEYVVVVREGVLSFIHVLGKVLLSAMEVEQADGTTAFSANPEIIVANIASKPAIVQSFEELLQACFVQGNAWNSPHRYPPPSYVQPLQYIIDSGELFVLCHELAHIRLGHFRPDSERAALAQQAGLSEAIFCEYQADLVGMHDALAVMGANFGGSIREAASGISLVLTGLDLFERSRPYFKEAEPSRPDPSHPSYHDRRAAIYARWSKYDMAEELLRGASIIDGTLETIWSTFTKQHAPVASTGQ